VLFCPPGVFFGKLIDPVKLTSFHNWVIKTVGVGVGV
jgi:hypothetical protein